MPGPGGFNPGLIPPGVNQFNAAPVAQETAPPATATPAAAATQAQASPVQAQPPVTNQSVVAHKLPSTQVCN